ncbi:MAG TPA: hypothetical protein VMS73_08680 [Anaerolineaceae bacterium]|nr:hypothetical protein [Anaerolineaceae bacterium]
MIKRLIGLLALLGVLMSILPLHQAAAARGTPGSSEFGYGAHLDLKGQYVPDGIQLANNLQVDWVAVDISWQSIQPSRENQVDWSRLDSVFALLEHYKITVMASVTQPPGWAVSKTGPDSDLAAKLVLQLVQHYPASISAVELFPAANTRSGWGARPDPVAYMALWKKVNQVLADSRSPVLLVAAGLVPQVNPSPDQLDDLEFLQGLYKAGARNLVQVFSLQMQNVTGEPATNPTQDEHRVLRHYEEIRQIMIQNQHDTGLLWITQLTAPLANDAASDFQARAQNQAAWLAQAFQQLRSQLYIGVAFLNRLNPSSDQSGTTSGTPLITLTGDLHPAFRVLRDQIAQNSSGGMDPRPGRPKTESLVKGH